MIEWKTATNLVPFKSAVKTMEQRVLQISNQKQNQLVWMLEHPHVYSGGTSSVSTHILRTKKIPVELTRRGGSYTYHGPGQRIIYLMLDLNYQGKDIRKFVWNLEQWIIESLKEIGVSGERRSKRVGIWVSSNGNRLLDPLPTNDLKIASIGLRIKNWISYFGASINVNPDLSYFDGIIPCGNVGYGVTSIEKLGLKASLTDVDNALYKNFSNYFIKEEQEQLKIVCDDPDS